MRFAADNVVEAASRSGQYTHDALEDAFLQNSARNSGSSWAKAVRPKRLTRSDARQRARPQFDLTDAPMH